MERSKPSKEKRHSFVKRFFLFGQKSSVHGLKHVFSDGGNFCTRTFWVLILIASSVCLYLLLMPVVLRTNDVTFTPDTLHLHWTTTFPAVTVCETYSSKIAQRKLVQLYPNLTEPLNFDYRRYIADLLYGRGACSRSVCGPCGDKIPCQVPWSKVVRDIHYKCTEMLSTCEFNNQNFSCCEEFLPVDSEYGPCYSFNSLQGKKINGNYKKNSLFTVNRTSGPGILSFRLISNAQISIHSTEELSTNVLDTKFKVDVKTYEDSQVDILFSVIEVADDPLVRSEDVEVRRCRYAEEVPKMPLHTYPVYSYGACRLAMNTEQSFKECGCIHPARDISYSDMYCNFTGLNCLVTYQAQKTKLGIDVIPDSEDCLPSCEETELTIVHISRRGLDQKINIQNGTLVNIKMTTLPTIRYQKDLLRTNLDFVVSVGGMVGLFFSASILSAAEVFYLIFRSP